MMHLLRPFLTTLSSFQTTHTRTHTYSHTCTHLTPGYPTGMSGLRPLLAKVVPILTECLRTRSASSKHERNKWKELSEAILLFSKVYHTVYTCGSAAYGWENPIPPHRIDCVNGHALWVYCEILTELIYYYHTHCCLHSSWTRGFCNNHNNYNT